MIALTFLELTFILNLFTFYLYSIILLHLGVFKIWECIACHLARLGPPFLSIKMLLETNFIIPYIQSFFPWLIPFSIHVIDSEQNIFKARTLKLHYRLKFILYPAFFDCQFVIHLIEISSDLTWALISWKHLVKCQYV